MTYCPYCMKKQEPAADGRCVRCGKPLSFNIKVPPHHLRPGTVLCDRRYLVGTTLGQGGFGITYIGRDQKLDVRVAIKEFYPNGYVSRTNTVSSEVHTSATAADSQAVFYKGRERFLAEARALAQFSGEPGIVIVRDFFEENNTVYIVMEYLDGKTMKQYMDQGKRFSPREVVELMLPVMSSLKEIHSANLLHRDISPDNIMLVKDKAKLIDFGAAREYDTGNGSSSIIVKPGYAPIEQYGTKREQGPWTDIYALCATMYKCITGILPDIATDRVVSDELKRPSQLGVSISPVMEAAIMKGMAVLKKDRYQNMSELIMAFKSPSVTAPQEDGAVVASLGAHPADVENYNTVKRRRVEQGLTTMYGTPIDQGPIPYINGGAGQVNRPPVNPARNNTQQGSSGQVYTQHPQSQHYTQQSQRYMQHPQSQHYTQQSQHYTQHPQSQHYTQQSQHYTQHPQSQHYTQQSQHYTQHPQSQHYTQQSQIIPNGVVQGAAAVQTKGSGKKQQGKPAKQKRSFKEKLASMNVFQQTMLMIGILAGIAVIAFLVLFIALDMNPFEKKVEENFSDITLPVVRINGEFYELPLSVNDAEDIGWVADAEKGLAIPAGGSKYITFHSQGRELVRAIKNNTDRDMRYSHCDMPLFTISDNVGYTATLAEVGVGTPSAVLQQKLEGVTYDRTEADSLYLYSFQGQNGAAIDVWVDKATELVTMLNITIEQ